MNELRYLCNLDLNFVNNYDMRVGNFNIALAAFLDVIQRVDGHAFAYYYASVCYKNIGQKEQAIIIEEYIARNNNSKLYISL